jgi:hypothetical protein
MNRKKRDFAVALAIRRKRRDALQKRGTERHVNRLRW